MTAARRPVLCRKAGILYHDRKRHVGKHNTHVRRLALAAALAFFACSKRVFCTAANRSRSAAFATAGTAAVSMVCGPRRERLWD